MVAFSAWYAPEKMGEVANAFTCVSTHPFAIADAQIKIFFQACISPLGRHRDHLVCLFDDIHLHRGEEQLPSWKYSHSEVSIEICPVL
jgi:hypothetical protein